MSQKKKHWRATQRRTRTRPARGTKQKAQTYPRPSTAGSRRSRAPFGPALSIEALVGLTGELQVVRQYPPVTKREDGKYEGDILGFVRGLRLSARVLYFLRDHLSGTGLEVSWGHLLNDKQESCSPECDIIVHEQGVVRRWNGFEDPVMNFSFVKASRVRFVVSCKSLLGSVDADYPRTLKKYGVTKVFLFAESCDESQFERIRKKAVRAGYAGMWCLYTTSKNNPSMLGTNDGMLIEFGQKMLAAVRPNRRRRIQKAERRNISGRK